MLPNRSTMPRSEARRRARQRPPVTVERLEDRTLLSLALPGEAHSHAAIDVQDLRPIIVAGDPNGSPTDSPSNRVDANTTDSPFAGVGSLQIVAFPYVYICSGAPISPTHILTAGHCFDLNSNGSANVSPSNVKFILNYGGNQTHTITAKSLHMHPDFTGFGKPSVNDDIAIVELTSALPEGVPIYSIHTGALQGQRLTLVGYGQSGDGVRGYYVNPSFTTKRVGQNLADDIYSTQDDTGRQTTTFEVWIGDFDGSSSSTNVMGGGTLGNTIETTLGGGDSGGPGFLTNSSGELSRDGNGRAIIASVNTFVGGNYPYFGSVLGGMNVAAYAGWIDSIITGQGGGGKGGGKGGGGKGGGGKNAKLGEIALDTATVPVSTPQTVSVLIAFVGPEVEAVPAMPDDPFRPATGDGSTVPELAPAQGRLPIVAQAELIDEALTGLDRGITAPGDDTLDSDSLTRLSPLIPPLLWV